MVTLSQPPSALMSGADGGSDDRLTALVALQRDLAAAQGDADALMRLVAGLGAPLRNALGTYCAISLN